DPHRVLLRIDDDRVGGRPLLAVADDEEGPLVAGDADLPLPALDGQLAELAATLDLQQRPGPFQCSLGGLRLLVGAGKRRRGEGGQTQNDRDGGEEADTHDGPSTRRKRLHGVYPRPPGRTNENRCSKPTALVAGGPRRYLRGCLRPPWSR